MTRISGIAGAFVLACNGLVALAHAQAPPTTIAFPMVGIGFGQTFRLNVISFNPCLLDLTIYDRNGVALVNGSFPPQSFKITFGTVKQNYVNQVSSFPNRAELRADVKVKSTTTTTTTTTSTTSTTSTTNPCQAQATVEVYDDVFEFTSVVTPGVLQPPGPTSAPPGPSQFGPVGLGFAQTARLNLVALPPGPCMGTLSFLDTQGNPIGPQAPVSLASGQAIFLDLPGQMVVPAFGQHGEVIAMFTPDPLAAPGACIASVEVFDQFSGYTRVLLPPGPSQ
jgi:hypothetical protein